MALRPQDITIFDIAAGTGMFSAAIELACAAVGVRARTIGFCERDACAAACLVARMEGKTLAPAPIWDDIRTLDCKPWRGQVDCLCAGYPCQPFSTAGKQLGHRDPRHLWPAVRRAIARIEPGIVFLENVEGHVGKGVGKVLRDLQRLGYRATAGLFSSAEVGAPHQRKRLFILGATGVGQADASCSGPEGTRAGGPESQDALSSGDRRDLAEPDSNGSAGQRLPTRQNGSEDSHDNGRGGKLADPERDGQSGDIGNAGTGGKSEPSDSGRDLGHANGDGGKPRRVPKSNQRRAALGAGHRDIPRYPPGKRSWADWIAVAEMDQTRMPSIESSLRCVAAGLAGWSDEIRLIGNGVDPLVAAYAFLSLWACLGE